MQQVHGLGDYLVLCSFCFPFAIKFHSRYDSHLFVHSTDFLPLFAFLILNKQSKIWHLLNLITFW